MHVFELSVATCTGSEEPCSTITKQKPHGSCFSISFLVDAVTAVDMITDSKRTKKSQLVHLRVH